MTCCLKARNETVADARGVPVRLLGIAFLALVGAATAEATQAVGALLPLSEARERALRF